MNLFAVTAFAFAAGLSLSAAVIAQDANPAPQPGQPQQAGQRGPEGAGRRGWGNGMGEGRGLLGTVTEAAPDHFQVKTENGDLYTVHFSVNTRIIKAPPQRQRGQGGSSETRTPPQTIKPTDIKVGDAITAGGEMDAAAKSVGAVFIALLDPEQARRMHEMEANFGKTWLAGRITAVDGVKVTIQGGPGNASHSFTADENTTFRKRRDPITLADMQVGDAVRVEGTVKDGAFVAASVAVMSPQSRPEPGSEPQQASPAHPN